MGQLVLEFTDTPFQEALAVFGRGIFSVLAQVPVRAGFLDSLDILWALDPFQFFEFAPDALIAFRRHRYTFQVVAPVAEYVGSWPAQRLLSRRIRRHMLKGHPAGWPNIRSRQVTAGDVRAG